VAKANQSALITRKPYDAEISDAIAPLGLDAATQQAVLDRSAKRAER
jgi:hypothetical protein